MPTGAFSALFENDQGHSTNHSDSTDADFQSKASAVDPPPMGDVSPIREVFRIGIHVEVEHTSFQLLHGTSQFMNCLGKFDQAFIEKTRIKSHSSSPRRSFSQQSQMRKSPIACSDLTSTHMSHLPYIFNHLPSREEHCKPNPIPQEES